jgi:hypothetical protein
MEGGIGASIAKLGTIIILIGMLAAALEALISFSTPVEFKTCAESPAFSPRRGRGIGEQIRQNKRRHLVCVKLMAQSIWMRSIT